MIRYYLLIFLRNLRRNPAFSFINLSGLTIGIVSTFLIYLYVQQELSHDKFHVNAENIYRINQTFIWGDDNNQLASSTGPGVAISIAEEIPEAQQVMRIHQPGGSAFITYKNQKNEALTFDESAILLSDSNFFKVFTFPLLKGDPNTALQRPNTVVITASIAKKYFGDENPIGKILEVDGSVTGQKIATFEVTGVVADIPPTSYIEFDFMMSMTTLPRVKNQGWSWIWTMFETFVVLDPRADVAAVREKVQKMPAKYAEQTLQWAMGTTYEEYVKSGKQWNLYLQPLTDIHLRSENVINRLNDVGNRTILYVLSGIVVFIILLSCINFMNLSTAQYTRRAREAGLRKVLGSQRWQLVSGFFLEAFLFCTFSLLMAIGITELMMPRYNDLTNNQYELNFFSDTTMMTTAIGLLLGMSLLCGSYPAIFLSAFRPADAMKGKLNTGREGKSLRNGLVVFQFSISMVLIACTLIVYDQLQFLSNKDVGFDRENLMVINRSERVNDKNTFIHSLTSLPGVEEASWCTSVPPQLWDGDSFLPYDNPDKPIALNYVNVDENYAGVLKLEMAQGRSFRKDSPGDVNTVVINETAARELGWAIDETIVGKTLSYPGGTVKYAVIGVVKDFNYWALNGAIQPMAMFHINNSELKFRPAEYTVVRLRASDPDAWPAMIGSAHALWQRFAGDIPFQYTFVDQTFASTFSNEQKFGTALSVFSTLAILIACLGLLGMIIFTVETRIKEIGIRKVVGASVTSILFLISRQYARLILVALVISVPVSLWLMNKWLESFLHRVKMSPSVFVIAGVSTLTVAFLITSYHALKAALMNPVDVLKDE